jgi:putative SOS response-associated peptidase YedK
VAGAAYRQLPWLLQGANGGMLAFADLWDRWKRENQVIESCTIVVGPANKAFSSIHDRMPFILPKFRQADRLGRELVNPDRVLGLLQPNADSSVRWHRISARVNSARNQAADLVQPLVA